MKKIFFFKISISILITFLMTVVSWILNGKSLIGVDDANIFFVYMRNISHGHGFVYNIDGEYVEGFTSLLWTLIGAFFFLISSKPELFLLFFNIAIVSYSLYRLDLFINKYFNNNTVFSKYSMLFFGLMVLIPGYFDWCVLSLMETGLWSSLLIITAINILEFECKPFSFKHFLKFSTLIMLLVICRPESIIWIPFFLIFKALKYYLVYKNYSKAFINILPFVLFFAVSVLSLTFWRFFYFGYLLPNTYYAKVSANFLLNLKEGFLYILNFLFSFPVFVFIIILCLTYLYNLFIKKSLKNDYIYFFLFSIIVFAFLIILYAGGDYFHYYRFIQPTIPLFYICFILVLARLKVAISYNLIIAFLCFLLFSGWLTHYYLGRVYPTKQYFDGAKDGRVLGYSLNTLFSQHIEYPSQGVIAAGGTAYTYKGFTNDILGLNNTEMAHAERNKNKNQPKNHASFNKKVFYKQKPDVFWIAGFFLPSRDIANFKGLSVHEFDANVCKNIHNDVEFKKLYSNCLIFRDGFDKALAIYASNSFLYSLDTTVYKVIVYE